MKFGVCAIIKNENLYLREWVEHYINLGFDKIILYDNNDTNGEMPNIVIQDYIDKEIVDIYNKRGINKNNVNTDFILYQANVYNECLEKYKNELDWIAFLDIDEFLCIEKYKKVQYLFDDMTEYEKYDTIIMTWNIMGNKNALYYNNEPVKKRFKEKLNGYYDIGFKLPLDNIVKSFVKTSRNVIFVTGPHLTNSNNICNVYGIKCNINDKCIALVYPNNNTMYVNHYYTKSLVEYLYKRKFGTTYERDINMYKCINGWTEEHEKVYQKFLKENNIKAFS